MAKKMLADEEDEETEEVKKLPCPSCRLFRGPRQGATARSAHARSHAAQARQWREVVRRSDAPGPTEHRNGVGHWALSESWRPEYGRADSRGQGEISVEAETVSAAAQGRCFLIDSCGPDHLRLLRRMGLR
jgi:hypothetical protein